jgi:hypothetical protein
MKNLPKKYLASILTFLIGAGGAMGLTIHAQNTTSTPQTTPQTTITSNIDTANTDGDLEKADDTKGSVQDQKDQNGTDLETPDDSNSTDSTEVDTPDQAENSSTDTNTTNSSN